MEAKTPTYIAYYRVSTKQQGASGLGLEAQRKAVKDFARCETCIIDHFTDIESGKNDERPELAKAIAKAKATNSRLVIAKLDRLSRNASFIFRLRDTGVDFVAADMPDANTLTIGIFATLAQHERELISSRTKAALQAKKAQGHILGTPSNLTAEARAKAHKAVSDKAAANNANRQAMAVIQAQKANGSTFRAIADYLNELGYKTSRGNNFAVSTVKMLYDRSMKNKS